MLISGTLKFGATGRVLVDLTGATISFNGGSPIAASGGVATTIEDPQAFLSGVGYTDIEKLCVRDQLPDGGFSGGFGRTSAGSLAMDLVGPITDYIAGIPITNSGRIAVEVIGTPPNLSGFTDGFESDAFF